MNKHLSAAKEGLQQVYAMADISSNTDESVRTVALVVIAEALTGLLERMK